MLDANLDWTFEDLMAPFLRYQAKYDEVHLGLTLLFNAVHDNMKFRIMVYLIFYLYNVYSNKVKNGETILQASLLSLQIYPTCQFLFCLSVRPSLCTFICFSIKQKFLF